MCLFKILKMNLDTSFENDEWTKGYEWVHFPDASPSITIEL